MPASVLFHLRHLSSTTGPTMALRRPFFFPSLKLKHAPFHPTLRPRFSVRGLSSSPSCFRDGFSRKRTDASRERSRDRVAFRESPKSLVDDEGELSDWVNDLRTSSDRGKLRTGEDGGGMSMRARNGKRRRESEDDYEGPRRGISDRRVVDRNKGRSTSFQDSMAKGGTGNYNSPRKVASFSNGGEEFHRGGSGKGEDRRVKGGLDRRSGKGGGSGKGEDRRVKGGLDRRSGKGDDKATSVSKPNGKRLKGGLDSSRRIDAAPDEDDEFNMGMLKKSMDGLISEDDDDEGDEIGRVEEEKNKEKEVNMVGDVSYLSKTR